jgi:hypothetical protein
LRWCPDLREKHRLDSAWVLCLLRTEGHIVFTCRNDLYHERD